MAAKRQRHSAEFKSKVAFAALKGDKTRAQLWMRVRGFRRPDRSVEEAASARGSGDHPTQRHSAGCRDVGGPPLPGDRSTQDGAQRAQKNQAPTLEERRASIDPASPLDQRPSAM